MFTDFRKSIGLLKVPRFRPFILGRGTCRWRWVSSCSGKILTGHNRSTRWRTCPIANIFITNLTWTGLGSNRASEMRGRGLKEFIKNNVLYSSWDLSSSGILCSALWWLFTDVSEQPICPIFKVQVILRGFTDSWRWDPIGCPETSVRNYAAQYPRRAEISSNSGWKPEIYIRLAPDTVSYFITCLCITYGCVWSA